MKRIVPLVVGAVLAGMMACTPARQSPAGFRLPESGDVDRGRTAFLELGCNKCHRVAGEDLPAPTADPAVPVILGGRVHEVRTDGYLVTSIIHPSHRIVGYPKEDVSAEGVSRMPEHAHAMTVRQLVDVVAYLQSRYTIVPPPQMYH